MYIFLIVRNGARLMIIAAINILILSVLLLIVGLIKPKWLLFWIDNPGRMPIIMLASVLFMIAVTLFGEGNRQKQEAMAAKENQEVAQQADTLVPLVEEEKK
jgi:hypothetical protein